MMSDLERDDSSHPTDDVTRRLTTRSLDHKFEVAGKVYHYTPVKPGSVVALALSPSFWGISTGSANEWKGVAGEGTNTVEVVPPESHATVSDLATGEPVRARVSFETPYRQSFRIHGNPGGEEIRVRWGVVAAHTTFNNFFVERTPEVLVPEDTRRRVRIPIHGELEIENAVKVHWKFTGHDVKPVDDEEIQRTVRIRQITTDGVTQGGDPSIDGDKNPAQVVLVGGTEPDVSYEFKEPFDLQLYDLEFTPCFEGSARARGLSFGTSEDGSLVVSFTWAVCWGWSRGRRVYEFAFDPVGVGLGFALPVELAARRVLESHYLELRKALITQGYLWTLDSDQLRIDIRDAQDAGDEDQVRLLQTVEVILENHIRDNGDFPDEPDGLHNPTLQKMAEEFLKDRLDEQNVEYRRMLELGRR